MAISLKLDRNPVNYETKKISKWNISQDLVQRACLSQVLWNPEDTVDSLACKITDWLYFNQNLALSVKTVKCTAHKKEWFSHDLRSLRDRWKEESDPVTKKSLRNSYVNELCRVKASFFRDKAAKLSKSGGVYKGLSARNKADGGLKILDPGTEKLLTEESMLCDIFLNKFKNKSSDLHKGTENIENYRPVILMSNTGKILESAVIGNVMPHIDVNIPLEMHGFRPNRTTETALCALLEEIKSERSKKKKVMILALDCSAAFDILNCQPDSITVAGHTSDEQSQHKTFGTSYHSRPKMEPPCKLTVW